VILILTNEGDSLQEPALSALASKGARVARFNTCDFPQRVGITLSYRDRETDSAAIHLPDGRVDVRDITTVWNRRPLPPIPDPRLKPVDQEFVVKESQHVLDSLWHCLRDRFWVNPFDSSRAAGHKPYQLQVARSVGLEIPRTLLTNETQEVEDFFERCGGQMIYKSLRPFAHREDGTPRGVFTTRVEREHLAARLEQITLAPCLFQEYIPKKSELRVTIIGHRTFTSEIDSQQAEHTKVDWRRGVLRGPLPQRPFVLPEHVELRARELMRRLGLVFGCLDFIRTPDDRFVFLEVNPNGQWYWVERDTGMPLLAHFTEMLIQGTPTYGEPVDMRRA